MKTMGAVAGLKIDHIGMVVADLEASLAYYREDLGYSWDGAIKIDPLQMVRFAFVQSPDGAVRFELLQPTCAESPLTGSLKRRIRFVHVCYCVDDLQQALDRFVTLGGRVISEPKPGVAFHGRPSAFVFTRDGEVVELAESQAASRGARAGAASAGVRGRRQANAV